MSKIITHLFTHQLVIRRLRTVSGYKRSFQSTATVDGLVQNMSKEKAQVLGITESRPFIGYIDIGSNVRIGDVVINYDGKRYEVKDITKKDYGINTHLECVLIETNE